ncbi:MAG: DNA methylase [Anaerofustis stercorihominis]|nr:DNA methylase [Anaerofustis stercorihominis]
MEDRIYLCIDLKSFYASVECIERGLDPMRTNLVVADPSRTEKTICLAVSPYLKSFGVPGRPRLFEVVQRIKRINEQRIRSAPHRKFSGESFDDDELTTRADLAVGYIVAPPRMAYYIEYSTRIYNVYLQYVAPEDIHVYSIDEVFMDITDYLHAAKCSPKEFARRIIKDVLKTTGITATAGIGTNMYLAKVAMDIVAKRITADEYGVRIAELDEMSYRKELWNHRPLTDFWRIGNGYAKKLEEHGMFTMGDIALCSVGKANEYHNEELLYKLFGVNAELLIDHAWGWEPSSIKDIKNYRPVSSSIGSGQVLHCPYDYDRARIVVREMAELLVLDLVDKGLATDQIVLTVGYDIDNLKDPQRKQNYRGAIKTDHYGRKVPKHAHGTTNLSRLTSSSRLVTEAVMKLYDDIVDKSLLIRRINITANRIVSRNMINDNKPEAEQLDFFTDYEVLEKRKIEEEAMFGREEQMQHAVIEIKKKYGKNAVLKGLNLREGATAKDRNRQIGGHKA